MKNKDQIIRELSEMWDALGDIPYDDPGREAAHEEGREIEARMWVEYTVQERLFTSLAGKVVDGKIPFHELTLTAQALDGMDFIDGGWIEFRFNQIKNFGGYSTEDVFYVENDYSGVMIPCRLSTLALKIY